VVEEERGPSSKVDSLKNLVDEFSQFARPSVSAAPHELNPLVSGTLDLYDGLFSGLTLTRLFAPDIPKVMVDPELIRRVFINIIDNAIEANHGQGQVVVSTFYDRDLQMARVEVADDGPGIAPADRDKLFMPYYSTKLRGSGLGLAIVQRVVAEHRGRIRVEENEPHGARFVIELPIESISDSIPSPRGQVELPRIGNGSNRTQRRKERKIQGKRDEEIGEIGDEEGLIGRFISLSLLSPCPLY
jgi:signal transduction histidine kinase